MTVTLTIPAAGRMDSDFDKVFDDIVSLFIGMLMASYFFALYFWRICSRKADTISLATGSLPNGDELTVEIFLRSEFFFEVHLKFGNGNRCEDREDFGAKRHQNETVRHEGAPCTFVSLDVLIMNQNGKNYGN